MAEDTAGDDPTGPFATVRETHIGVVFMVGDRAYKLKKPVRTPFLDFSTRQRRLAVCRREVELNRRLSPDVYLGVADVTGTDGEPCDHLVVLRRMPEDRRLATLLSTVGDTDMTMLDDALWRLARLVAAFHANAERGPEITAEGGRDALRARWVENIDELHRFRDTMLDHAALTEIEERALRFLDGREPLLSARQREGRIVDGHGDLLTGDIFCLDDGPRVLDCLEFDDRLRYLDGLDDAAFLAMDLEYRGAPELGEKFLRWYAEFAGDPAPPALADHYVAYRALVRAKVACLRGEQEAGTEAGSQDSAEAHSYARIALRHLRAAEVRLVLIGGTPGTGKSTVSEAVAQDRGWVLLSSDRVRKESHGLGPHESGAARYGEGLYGPEATDRTYSELLSRAAKCLAHAESVVLDASWTREAHRAAAAEVARDLHAELVSLRCTAPPEVVAERLRHRTGSVSDADETIANAVAASADPWPHAITVDTGGSVDDSTTRALRALSSEEHEEHEASQPATLQHPTSRQQQ